MPVFSSTVLDSRLRGNDGIYAIALAAISSAPLTKEA